MISAGLDYLPLSFLDFLLHFTYLFIYNKSEIINRKKNTLYGSSCRSLFHTIIKKLLDKKDNQKILVSPIHHTSFRNIIELFFEPQNITVLPMNENYNKVLVTPEIANNHYDICVISHLFGQDLDTSELEKLQDKENCLFIEDRVQGGEFKQKFSDMLFDISLYSCGMDKKPCALGGGIMYARKNGLDIILEASEEIKTYKQETRFDRFLFILKKIPTYIIYNCKFIITIILLVFKIFSLDLYKFICYYRKKNPGFMHDNYNLQPCSSTLKSIQYSLENVNQIEKEEKYKGFVYSFLLERQNIKNECIPWDRGKDLLTIYNTIVVKNKELFINHLNYNNIPVIDNPTYKLFNFDYDTKEQDESFNNSLVYIPTLYNMPFWEIKELVEIIKSYNI
jgi:hypothetical protein